MKTRKCKQCQTVKELTLEFFHSSGVDKFHYSCKLCKNKSNREYKSRPESKLKAKAVWDSYSRTQNYKNKSKIWKELNKENISKQCKTYRESHKEEIAESKRRSVAKKPEHYNMLARKWQLNNPVRGQEIKLNSHLRKTFKLTLQEYTNILDSQNGVCRICKQKPSKDVNGFDRLVVDHNHNTGQVRGLLCHFCNSGLGFFRDSATTMNQAITYLNETSSYGQ